MRAKLIFLSLLLLVQLGLAFALGLGGKGLQAFDATEKLLKFEQGSLDRLVFAGGDKQQLVLQKQDGHWTLPDHFGALADGHKIEKLLKSLTELNRPWPVAENGTADKRFKVADDSFERRLTFFQGDKKLGRLIIGSSPGFRKVHARVGGEKTVYDIPFSSYQVSLKPEDWIDKGQLQLKDEQVSSISLADCRLVRRDKKLEVEGLSAREQTDSGKAAELLHKLTSLTILDVLDKPQQSMAAPAALSLSLGLADGQSRSYQFIKASDGKELQLQVSDQPYLYKIAPGLKDDLATFTRAQLVQQRPADKPEGEETPPVAK